MEVEGVNTIFLFVSDLSRSQDFYQKLSSFYLLAPRWAVRFRYLGPRGLGLTS